MTGDFIQIQDRIIAAAIDVISESGLSQLTTKNLALKANMTDVQLYRYYEDIDAVLVDVVEFFFKFDKNIRKTIESKKNESALSKIMTYVKAYGTYYDNYYAVSTLMLQYEELLHNSAIRDRLAWGIAERTQFFTDLFDEAIKNNEIETEFTADQLCATALGIVSVFILKRRLMECKDSYKQEIEEYYIKWLDSLKKK